MNLDVEPWSELTKWKIVTAMCVAVIIIFAVIVIVQDKGLVRITDSTYDMCMLNNNLIELINVQSGLIEEAYPEYVEGELTRVVALDCVALYGG